MSFIQVLQQWPLRRWITALVAGLAVAMGVAIPADVIPNPIFGRDIAVTWWSYPVTAITGLLGGLLIATYIKSPIPKSDDLDKPGKFGVAGTLVSFFAVGCPVCNKLVLLALGYSGALTWFAPAQPFLALASLALLTWALKARLKNEYSCQVTA